MIDDEIAARLCLLTMPGMGPARLGWLTAEGSSVSALASIKRGQLPVAARPTPRGVNAQMIQSWQHHANQNNGQELLETHREAGIQILAPGDEAWPYENDPEPPSLLFTRGRVQLLDQEPMVGIVGTRRCSSVGRRVARQLGSELASAGVGIVSGLALGIDGAAHVGALESCDQQAPVVGVVATGLDIVYPNKHGDLWEEIAERGVLISEAPLGTMPQRWRFPARNRLLAGLCGLVVVVESHERGGALSTVEEAIARSVDVVAVPGSVLSAASAGSNTLLYEGCAPVRSAQDVLGWIGAGVEPLASSPEADQETGLAAGTGNSLKRADDSVSLLPLEKRVLAEVSSGGLHLDALFGLLSCSLGELLDVVQRLENRDFVSLEGSIVTLGEWSP